MSFNFKDAQLNWFNQDAQATTRLNGLLYTSFVSSTFGTVGAAGSTTVTQTIKGLIPKSGSGTAPNVDEGDIVLIAPQSAALPGGIAFYAFVSAANTLSITCVNGSAGGVVVGTQPFNVLIFKMGQNDGINS
jgi:hypothetical protein